MQEKKEVPKLQLPSGRKTISRFQTTVVKDEERSKRNRIRRTQRRMLHEESKDDASYLNLKSEGAKRDVTFTLSIAGAWRGPIEVSCDAIVRDLKRAIMEKSGVHYTYQHLSLRRGKKGSFSTNETKKPKKITVFETPEQ